MLWAPLYHDTARGGAPPGCVWRQQLEVPLRWIKAFMDGNINTLTRVFTLGEYLDEGVKVKVTTDASPWGIGGFISFDGRVVAYFHDALSSLDFAMFAHARGDHTGQQTWEALALLVALRLWAPLWKGKRVVITVRSDSV